MKKTRKKLLAVLLAFTMLFGSSMTVFAADYEWQNLQVGDELQNGDTISVTHATLMEIVVSNGYVSIIINNDNDTQENYNGDANFKKSRTINVASGKVWKVTRKVDPAEPTSTTLPFCVYGEVTDPTPQTPSTNPDENKPSSNPVKEPTKIEEVHEHSYSWVTVQEPGAGQDGIEEYRCSCGAVAERNVIPAGMAMVKDLVRQIETAPENSTVEIKTEYFTCYTAYIMNALKKRPDVSLKTTFKDYDKDGSIKTFTIPAGKAPDDGELFYGFTYLGNLYGWDE